MASKPRFTRIPKTIDLIKAGAPAEMIPTYCALADHANNKTGLCWPTMERLAGILNRSVRTIQRHLQLLRELGLIAFVERRRYKGRFSSYLYKVIHIATTGHGGQVDKRDPNRGRTKPSLNLRKGTKAARKSSAKSVTDGYEWLFDDAAPQEKQHIQEQEEKHKRQEGAKRRTAGYEWLFGK